MNITQREKDYLLNILSAVINYTFPPNPPDDMSWANLYRLSAFHKVSNIVAYGIQMLNSDVQPIPEIMARFNADYKREMAREATQHLGVEELLQLFEKHQIKVMPLKGYLLKDLYPRPDLRTMVDVDILFDDQDTEAVKALMLGFGFTLVNEGGNHDVYHRKPFLGIEMHRRLMSETSPYSSYFKKVWSRARFKPGYQYVYELSREDCFVYIVSHLAKHFSHGGIGIRSIMDIWLYGKQYGAEMDWNYIQEELRKIDLCEFTRNICGLSEVWFSHRENTAMYDEIAEYLFSSGVGGTRRNAMLSAMIHGKNRDHSIGVNKLLYWYRLFFPRLNQMKIAYPMLTRFPFLLPLTWVYRGVRSVLLKRQHTFDLISAAFDVSDKELSKIRAMRRSSGI